MYINSRHSQRGFTIIELLIATAIFSVIVLIATTVLIRIGQQYYKGVTMSKTQEAGRAVMEDITRVVQFSSSDTVTETALYPSSNPNFPKSVLCVGDSRYFYSVGTQFKSPYGKTQQELGSEGLVAQRIKTGYSCQTCPQSATACVDAPEQLLGENMRLQRFEVTKIANSEAWNISVGIAYGDGDLLSGYNSGSGTFSDVQNARCIQVEGRSINSFCATTRLDTIVKRRVQ